MSFIKNYVMSGFLGGNGGVSSWNDLTDKPFGEMPTGGNTLTWNGNTDGIENIENMFFKISDTVFTETDITNGLSMQIAIPANGTEAILAEDELKIEIAPMSEDGTGPNMIQILTPDNIPCVFSVPYVPEMEEEGVSFGTYFMSNNGEMFVKSLTINNFTGFPIVKKVDEKYLPEPIILYTDFTYLYNENKPIEESRTTVNDLKSALLSTSKIIVKAMESSQEINILPSAIVFKEGYGYAAFTEGMEYVLMYTAEYTPAE